MSTSATIEKTCAVTRKGQTTLPLAVRQLLGVPEGGHIMVRAEGRRVTIEPVETEHSDPAIGAFLRLIANDIASGRTVNTLPDDLLQSLQHALQDVEIDLDEPIDGDVCL
jgi:antitoxin PrlF